MISSKENSNICKGEKFLSDNYDMTIDFVESNLNIARNLYDSIRLVDPNNKKVLFYNEGVFVEGNESCFSKLNKITMCENCISMRAIKNKSTFTKIENVDEKVYLIYAIPFDVNDKTVVVELIKDVTNSLFYGSSIDKENCKVNDIIQELKILATKDSLTGVYNRRFIDERLPIEIDRCIKNNEPISILMLDVDYFKKINDNFGHIAGDFVLKEFTNCLEKCIRKKRDWIARYGGEEFLVCIPGAREDEAFKIAERMRSYIAGKIINYKDEALNITTSIGIYTITDESITMEEFLNCADKKLYKAKSSGRNKIVF